jgi:hypothetical protein
MNKTGKLLPMSSIRPVTYVAGCSGVKRTSRAVAWFHPGRVGRRAGVELATALLHWIHRASIWRRGCLIACHASDTLGAVAAGWKAALIKRIGNDVLGVGPRPHILGADFGDVADQLVALQKE